MTWRLPDTYHLAGGRQGTATFKFYEGRDILGVALAHAYALISTHIRYR
jgi:hypothetical protein